MTFYLYIAGLIGLMVLMLAAMIGVIVLGAHVIGPAMGSKELDSADAAVRQRAMLRLVAAGAVFVALCKAFSSVIGLMH